MSRRPVCLLLAVVTLFVAGTSVDLSAEMFVPRKIAQKNSADRAKPEKAASDRTKPAKERLDKPESREKPQKARPDGDNLTAEREAAAEAFVAQHHPELARLLTSLKRRDKESYAKAVRQLSRDSRKLTETLERDPKIYALKLRLWQAESRIQLLSARLSMGDNPALQKELRLQLGQRHDARTAMIQLLHDRAAQKTAQLAEELTHRETTREETIDRNLKTLLRTDTAKNTKN